MRDKEGREEGKGEERMLIKHEFFLNMHTHV